MQVDISNLSAKELFELAKQKELEEKEASARKAMEELLEKLMVKRDELVTARDDDLAEIDKKIDELTEQREQIIASHEDSISEVDSEIEALNKKLDQEPSEKPSAKAASSAKKPEPAPKAETKKAAKEPMDAADRILEMLKVRSYVSHGMLEETLKSEGIDLTDLSKKINNLIRSKKIVRRSGGNYALKK